MRKAKNKMTKSIHSTSLSLLIIYCFAKLVLANINDLLGIVTLVILSGAALLSWFMYIDE
jgi:hypothetical protein